MQVSVDHLLHLKRLRAEHQQYLDVISIPVMSAFSRDGSKSQALTCEQKFIADLDRLIEELECELSASDSD